MDEISSNVNNPMGELVNLIGVRTKEDSGDSDVYFVYLYSVELDFPGDPSTPPDTPITTDNKKILFCARPELAPILYRGGQSDLTKWGECPDKVTATIDMPVLLNQLKEECGEKYSQEMFYFLAILLDVMDAIDVDIPSELRDPLLRLFSHQTANKQLDTFFVENEITRDEILHVISWCVESIASNSVCIIE